MKKNSVNVEVLKKDVEVYTQLETENANGWEWYSTCALGNLLQDESVTMAYVQQITKQELDLTLSLSLDIVENFQSVDLACAFVSAYTKYYGQGLDKENFYENEIQPLMEFIRQRRDLNSISCRK